MTQPSTEDLEQPEEQQRCARASCDTKESTNVDATHPFCARCVREIVKALRELPEHYIKLGFALAPSSGAGGQRVSGSREAPLPLRADVMALQEDIATMLMNLEDLVRRSEGFTAAGRQLLWTVTVRHAFPVYGTKTPAMRSVVAYQGYDSEAAIRVATANPGSDLSSSKAAEPLRRDAVHTPDMTKAMILATRFLLTAMDMLLAGPAGPAAGNAILRYHGKARMMLGLSRGDAKLPMPCPDCGEVALVRKGGTETIECAVKDGGCGRVEADDEEGKRMTWMVRVMAADLPDRLLPAGQAAQLAGVNHRDIAVLERRGKLHAVMCLVKGRRHLYRVGDVLKLTDGHKPKDTDS